MEVLKEEREYLKKVLEEIKKEIEKSNENLESLYSLGKTLSFEDRQRGEHFNVNTKISYVSKKINALTRSIPSPYFGRMDFKAEQDSDYNKFYIGRTGISSEEGDLLVVDWRSPVSSMFYNNSIGNAEYEAPDGKVVGDIKLKRQIIIENSKLKEILDTDIVTNDEILQEYLNVHADEKMKNIVASIQTEQNNIIRKPLNKNLIIQGVAGSGKTSVALHRIAFLLYNIQENIKNENFLLLGPNNYFLDYISSVLPDLEIDPINQKRFLDYALEYVEEKLSIKNISYKPQNEKELNAIKKILRYKNSLKYKNDVQSFMNDYLEGNFIKTGIKMGDFEVFNQEFVKASVLSGVSSKFNFEKAKKRTLMKFKDNIDSIYTLANKKYKKIYTSENVSPEEKKMAIQKSDQLREEIYKKGEKTIKDFYKKLNKKTSEIYKEFINNCDKYITNLSPEELKIFKNVSLSNNGKLNITPEDLSALIFIKSLLTNKKNDYAQIAIDEAQDYGLFQYYVLLLTSPNANFSIYGDLAQSIYPYTNVSDWEIVKKEIFNDDCEILKLNKSYRTTSEITENANTVLNTINLDKANSVERHGKPVMYHEKTKEDSVMIEKINEWLKKGYQSVGIICKNEKEALQLYKILLKSKVNVSYLNEKSDQYAGGIYITTSIASKGLEFDAVIINDASSSVYNPENKDDMHLLYVALTRALHELLIIYKGELCKPLKENYKNYTKRRTK